MKKSRTTATRLRKRQNHAKKKGGQAAEILYLLVAKGTQNHCVHPWRVALRREAKTIRSQRAVAEATSMFLNASRHSAIFPADDADADFFYAPVGRIPPSLFGAALLTH